MSEDGRVVEQLQGTCPHENREIEVGQAAGEEPGTC